MLISDFIDTIRESTDSDYIVLSYDIVNAIFDFRSYDISDIELLINKIREIMTNRKVTFPLSVIIEDIMDILFYFNNNVKYNKSYNIIRDNVIDVEPSISYFKGEYYIKMDNNPTLIFYTDSFKIDANFRTVDFRNEMYLYKQKFDTKDDVFFKIVVEFYLSMSIRDCEILKSNVKSSFPVTGKDDMITFIYNMLFIRFDKTIRFNGWVGHSETAMISY